MCSYFEIEFSSIYKYTTLPCLFTGNDFFREVSPLLGAILDRLIERSAPDLDFESPIPGLTSFYDFYRELLEQFVGVSYGDPIFGRFVLVPLAQRHNVKYKKLLWSELAPVIRFLRTPLDQVNIKDYLEPCEIDPDMLVTYLQSLAIGRVNVNWCPVLYRMAVHHVATYIATCPAEDRVGIVLKDRIAKLGNKVSRN
ncbi:hypothetical protein AAG570_001092 [Ranatra chinensis]|uniref:RPAP1/MINIYO-like TPR repeats domain-containing protein n=1 Tax=Ranatra chinensis TaxID=642074 RepID=A0ABD0YAV2_9HEMI